MTELLDEILAREIELAHAAGHADVEVPAVDLATLFGELAALKNEVRTQTRESRKVVEACEQLASGPKSGDADAAIRALIDVYDRLEQTSRVATLRSWWPFGGARRALTSVAEGLQLTCAVISERLAEHEIHRTPTVGHRFDAETMEAAGTESRIDAESGVVISELVSGWARPDAVVRLARVIVNRPQLET